MTVDLMAPLYQDGIDLRRDHGRVIVDSHSVGNGFIAYGDTRLIAWHRTTADGGDQDWRIPHYTTAAPGLNVPSVGTYSRFATTRNFGLPFRAAGWVMLDRAPKPGHGIYLAFAHEHNGATWYAMIDGRDSALIYQEDRPGWHLEGIHAPYGKVWASGSLRWQVGRPHRIAINIDVSGKIRLFVDDMRHPRVTHRAKNIAASGQFGLRTDGCVTHFGSWTAG